MKIQPEFNIAAILSKISVEDVVGHQLVSAKGDTSPFESYFEAALQHIDDPQLAATIATLNKSGMIVPDSSEAFVVAEPGSAPLKQIIASDALPVFRTLQLLNGRSVITSHVGFRDQDILSADAAGWEESVAGTTLSAMGDAAPIKAAPVMTAAADHAFVTPLPTAEAWLASTATKPVGQGAAPIAKQAATIQAAIQNSVTQAPIPNSVTQAVPVLTALPLDNDAFMTPLPTAEAWLASATASTEKSPTEKSTTPVTMQASVAMDPTAAQKAQGSDALERRQSAEAWLANPVRMGGVSVPLAAGKVPFQAQQLQSRVQGVDRTDGSIGADAVDGAGGVDRLASFERRQTTEAWLSKAGKGGANFDVVNKVTLPALPNQHTIATLMVAESPAATPMMSAEPGGQFVLTNSPQVASNSATVLGQTTSNVNRAPDRWLHVDDLSREFGSIIKGSLLDRSVAGQTSLRIMLYPQNMGSIEAEIIENSHSVTVNLVAQSDEVVRLLKDNSQALRDALNQGGSVELNILKERSGQDAQQSRDASTPNSNRDNLGDKGAGAEGSDATSTAQNASDPGALDTYV